MIHSIIKDKPTRLFLILGGFFIANTLIAEVVGVKLFSLEQTLGMAPANLTLFGESGLGFTLSAGTLTWPIVFIMTDIINEYYGFRGVRFLSILTAAIIGFAFLVFYSAIHLAPDSYWTSWLCAGVGTRHEHYFCLSYRLFGRANGRCFCFQKDQDHYRRKRHLDEGNPFNADFPIDRHFLRGLYIPVFFAWIFFSKGNRHRAHRLYLQVCCCHSLHTTDLPHPQPH